ncbi:hypothetical protein PO909_007629 [Leuciscus waleckii]
MRHGWVGVFISTHTVTLYTHYDMIPTRSFFSPAPRRVTLSGAAAIQLLISSLSLSLPPSLHHFFSAFLQVLQRDALLLHCEEREKKKKKNVKGRSAFPRSDGRAPVKSGLTHSR